MPEIFIGGRPIGPDHAPFVIAEAGLNHNGELDKALEMVGVARKAGVDAVKFQTFQAAEFVGDPNQTYTYKSQGKDVTESMLAMFRRCELRRDDWFAIKKECDSQGIVFLSTPQNRSDLDLLLEVGVPAVKIGSDDFTNLHLLKSYASAGLPLILSCGMADMGEVYRALEAAGALDGHPVVLLVCTSQYPTPPEDVNLRRITTLRGAFPMIPIGFSDHTIGPLAASLALALGACVFEKHFTLSHDLPGPDHWFAAAPEELEQWATSIRTTGVMQGRALVAPTAEERKMRAIARRSVVALRDIAQGQVLTPDNTGLRRPGTGLAPEMLERVLGSVATRNIRAGEPLQFGDVSK